MKEKYICEIDPTISIPFSLYTIDTYKQEELQTMFERIASTCIKNILDIAYKYRHTNMSFEEYELFVKAHSLLIDASMDFPATHPSVGFDIEN